MTRSDLDVVMSMSRAASGDVDDRGCVMSVKITGAVLYSLYFEHNNTNGDREGFLLGRVTNHSTDTISDSHMNSVKTETVIRVHSYVACDCERGWYEGDGSVSRAGLLQVLTPAQLSMVVGWYKFRRNSSLVVSLRERAIHRALIKCLPDHSPGQFVFLLGRGSVSSNGSTHSDDHTFLSLTDRGSKACTVSIENLADTNTAQYKTDQTSVLPGLFGSTVQEAGPHFMDDTGKLQCVFGIHSLNVNLQKKLQELCEEVWVSEEEVGVLSEDIHCLQEQIASHRRANSRLRKEVPSPMLTHPAHRDSAPRPQPVTQTSQHVHHTSQLPDPHISSSTPSLVKKPSVDDLLFGEDFLSGETDETSVKTVALDEPTGVDKTNIVDKTGVHEMSGLDKISTDKTRSLDKSSHVTSKSWLDDLSGLKINSSKSSQHSEVDGESLTDGSLSASSSSLGSSVGSENRSEKKKDAFSFLDNMLVSAKSLVTPTKTKPTSESATQNT